MRSREEESSSLGETHEDPGAEPQESGWTPNESEGQTGAHQSAPRQPSNRQFDSPTNSPKGAAPSKRSTEPYGTSDYIVPVTHIRGKWLVDSDEALDLIQKVSAASGKSLPTLVRAGLDGYTETQENYRASPDGAVAAVHDLTVLRGDKPLAVLRFVSRDDLEKYPIGQPQQPTTRRQHPHDAVRVDDVGCTMAVTQVEGGRFLVKCKAPGQEPYSLQVPQGFLAEGVEVASHYVRAVAQRKNGAAAADAARQRILGRTKDEVESGVRT